MFEIGKRTLNEEEITRCKSPNCENRATEALEFFGNDKKIINTINYCEEHLGGMWTALLPIIKELQDE